MNIHEYKAKQILARYNVRIPRGEVAHTGEEARQIAERIGGTVVVKAQIHAGGRGKGGGVKLAKSPGEAAELAGKMLGMNLVTAQTGPEGRKVQKVLVEEGLDIRKELYLGIVIDRQTGRPVFMASASGGMDIEEALEIEASKFGLNYIKLDGSVACMVNGAGLAMATMDIIKLAGGSPANFLDVGGGASAEQVKNAFHILISDKNVKAVLINIFGGIMRCDVVASGVVEAAKAIGVQVPIVVRLEGTNVEQGQEILRNSGLNFLVTVGMKDAAEEVVASKRGIK